VEEPCATIAETVDQRPNTLSRPIRSLRLRPFDELPIEEIAHDPAHLLGTAAIENGEVICVQKPVPRQVAEQGQFASRRLFPFRLLALETPPPVYVPRTFH
jgi:hypothetical protein